MFRLCALVHILTLHVLSFQNPICCYPYYNFVYIVGFDFTEYKLVSPLSQSSLSFITLAVVPLYSLRTIIKVLELVILHCPSSFLIIPCHSSLFLVTFHHHHIATFSRHRPRRMGDSALYPYSAIYCVSVYKWFSHLCACRRITEGSTATAPQGTICAPLIEHPLLP